MNAYPWAFPLVSSGPGFCSCLSDAAGLADISSEALPYGAVWLQLCGMGWASLVLSSPNIFITSSSWHSLCLLFFGDLPQKQLVLLPELVLRRAVSMRSSKNRQVLCEVSHRVGKGCRLQGVLVSQMHCSWQCGTPLPSLVLCSAI